MDYCWYIYFKIRPTDQKFINVDSDPIIIRGLQRISDNYYYKLTDENGLRYYECVVELSYDAFAMYKDCRYYKWCVENEIILQCSYPCLINAKKLSLNQFRNTAIDIYLNNPVGNNPNLND